MTHDVVIGESRVVTTTDADAAARIAAAVEAEREHLFQMDGLRVRVEETSRDARRGTRSFADEVHDGTVADVAGMIAAANTVEEVEAIVKAERTNPRSAGPRVSLLNAGDSRIAELTTSDGGES